MLPGPPGRPAVACSHLRADLRFSAGLSGQPPPPTGMMYRVTLLIVLIVVAVLLVAGLSAVLVRGRSRGQRRRVTPAPVARPRPSTEVTAPAPVATQPEARRSPSRNPKGPSRPPGACNGCGADWPSPNRRWAVGSSRCCRVIVSTMRRGTTSRRSCCQPMSGSARPPRSSPGSRTAPRCSVRATRRSCASS